MAQARPDVGMPQRDPGSLDPQEVSLNKQPFEGPGYLRVLTDNRPFYDRPILIPGLSDEPPDNYYKLTEFGWLDKHLNWRPDGTDREVFTA